MGPTHMLAGSCAETFKIEVSSVGKHEAGAAMRSFRRVRGQRAGTERKAASKLMLGTVAWHPGSKVSSQELPV
jgi:hypothetical protein